MIFKPVCTWIVVTAILAASATSVRANQSAALEIRCPVSLLTSQSAKASVMPWTAVQQGDSSRLIYSELFAGSPEEEQIIVADDVKPSPGRETYVWHFNGRPSADGIWLVCTFQNTKVKLVRRLPDTITSCSQVNSTDPLRVVKLLEQSCH